MNRIHAYLLLSLMLLPLLIIPSPGVAQINNGVWIQADTNHNTYLNSNVSDITITDQGTLHIVINNSYLTWLGSDVRLSLIFKNDTTNPNSGGFFFRVSNVGDYGPSDPSQSPYGGVINVFKNGSLYDEFGHVVGRVTNLQNANTSGANVTVIDINMHYFDLSSVIYIRNVYLEESFTADLYTTPSLPNNQLAVKVFKASSWDATVSNNLLKIVQIPVSCSDVVINVNTAEPGPAGTHDVMLGDWVNVTVSFQKFFQKVKDVTGVDLSVTNSSILEMINYYDNSEQYVLANYDNGTLTNQTQPAFIQNPAYLIINNNGSAVFFHGVIADYAPSAAAPDRDEVSAFYMFATSFHYSIVNYTTNLTFSISCDSLTANSTNGIPFLYVVASMAFYWNATALHPGTPITFVTHNVPATYNKSNVDHMLLQNYVANITIPASSMAYLSYNINGTIEGTFVLPNATYGGYWHVTHLVMNDSKYINGPLIKITPYIETYIVTNNTLYAIESGNEYIALFTPADFAAPGDYLYVRGYGFDTTNETLVENEFEAYLNDTELWRASLIYSNTTGKVDAVFRIMDTNATPLPTGFYILNVGILNMSFAENNWSIPFWVVRNDTVAKVMLNPELEFNTTLSSYVIKHYKTGGVYGNFTVEYQLVNGTFQTSSWQLPTKIEIIGFTVDQANLTLFSQTWNISYPFIQVNLTYGYGAVDLYNKTIGFIPYGNYTLFLNGDTFRSINNRTVFNVLMGVNVEASECRNGTLTVTVVGGAPDTNMTLNFTYDVEEILHSISFNATPVWTGVLQVNVTTDIYGTGSTTLSLRNDVYPDNYVENATLDTLIKIAINAHQPVNIGNMTLVFQYDATLTGIDDNLGSGISYELGSSVTSFEFYTYVFAIYNFTLSISASTIIPRAFFVISVGTPVLPGDNVTVQIFPHQFDVWDLVVEPEWLYDVAPSDVTRIVWWIDARLVEPVTNNIVDRVEGWYVGSLVYQDLDNDGRYEFWFVVNLKAPLILGVDKVYRVDVKLNFSVATSNTTTVNMSLNTNDGGCNNNVTVNGTITFSGYASYLMPGGTHQVVEVLGVLEGKLDWIKNGVAEINATVNDINTYLKVNITDLLKAINGTVVDVKNDTATLLVGQAEIKASLSDLLALTTQVNDTVTMILECCGSASSRLARIEATLNETKEYVLQIRGNVSDIVMMLQDDVIPKFGELYHNITVQVNASRDMILYEIGEVNETLANYIISTNSSVNAVHDLIVNQLMPEMEEYYRNLTIQISDTNASITDTINTSTYTILFTIGFEADAIADLINTSLNTIMTTMSGYYGNLSMQINDTGVEIMGDINNSTMIILMDIDTKFVDINSTLDMILTNMADYYESLEHEINNVYGNLTVKIDNSTALVINEIDSANSSITMLINTSTNRLCSRLTTLQGLIEADFNRTFSLVMNESSEIKMIINDSKIELMAELENANSSIITTIETEGNMTRELTTSLIQNLNATILNRLDEMEGNLLIYMTAYEQRLEGLIQDTADDIVYNITATISSDYASLSSLINLKADMLSFEIDNSTSVILATIGNVNVTLLGKMDEIETLIDNSTAEIKTELGTISTNLDNYYHSLSDLVSNKANEIEMNVVKAKNDTATLILNVNDTMTMYIKGRADDITSLLNTLSNDMKTSFNDLTTKVDTVAKSLNKTLLNKLDNLLSQVSSKLDDQTATLKNAISSSTDTVNSKLDTLSKQQKNSADKINGNISIFGASILLLIVIVIGLVGYSLISGRRVG